MRIRSLLRVRSQEIRATIPATPKLSATISPRLAGTNPGQRMAIQSRVMVRVPDRMERRRGGARGARERLAATC